MSVEMDKISTRDAFGDVLVDLAMQNEKIMYLAADTLSVGGFKFNNQSPERALNVGIAEQNMTLMGAGMATCGAKVFIASYAAFASMRMCEQVRTFVAYPNLDVKIIAGMGGLSGGEEGVTHQGTEDVSIMRSIPNMVVVVPADAAATRVITKVITEYEGPVYLRLGKNESPKVFDDNYQFEIGKANIIKSEGEYAAIICNGPVTGRCVRAVEALKQAGYGVKLIEMPCVKPIDRETILWAAMECGLLVTMEDNNILGGLGSAVAEVVSEAGSAAIVKRMGLEDQFSQSGDCEELLDLHGFGVEDLVKTLQEEIEKGRRQESTWKGRDSLAGGNPA
jgi:transketolase